MTTDYKYSDNYLGISEHKVHLLRNKFEYQSIPFNQINEVKFKKGKAIKNWMIILTLGILLLSVGLFISKNIFLYYFSDEPGTIHIETIVASIFTVVFGVFLIIQSLKTEHILEIHYENKTKKFGVKSFDRESQLDNLISYLSENTKFKNEI